MEKNKVYYMSLFGVEKDVYLCQNQEEFEEMLLDPEAWTETGEIVYQVTVTKILNIRQIPQVEITEI